MRILKITEDSIEFDNGKHISSLITIRSVAKSIMLILSNLILWLVMLISANRLCLNHANMVSDSATRQSTCSLFRVTLYRMAIILTNWTFGMTERKSFMVSTAMRCNEVLL